MDISGIEPDTSRMLSERDKPTTPYARVLMYPNYAIYATAKTVTRARLERSA